MLTLVLVKILAGVTAVYYSLGLVRFFYYFYKFPGVMDLSFLNFVWKLATGTESQRCKYVKRIMDKHPYNVKILFGHIPLIIMNDADTIQKLFSSTSIAAVEKPYIYKFFGYGDGLITADTKCWRPHRRILNTAFCLPNLQSFVPIFDKVNKIFVQRLSERVGKGPFQIREYAAKSTLESICTTSFALDVKAEEDALLKFNECLSRADELAAHRCYSVQLHPEFIYKRSKFFKEDVAIHTYLNEFALKLIKKRQEIVSKESPFEANNNEEVDGKRRPNIFVDHLIRSGKTDGELVFTDNQIVDHAVTILLAGNETTTLTISICTVYLAIHQEAQEKAYQEIKEVLGDSTEVTYDNLRNMPYVEMVLKETLRLCPAVPMIARQITENINLDGVVFPKGTMMSVCVPTLHRNPKYWGPNAEEFNPDNFLPENIANRPPFSYMPFSAGIRNCLGSKYAMLSLKTMLVNLLLSYKFKTHLEMDKLRYRADIMLSIKNGYWVEIEKR